MGLRLSCQPPKQQLVLKRLLLRAPFLSRTVLLSARFATRITLITVAEEVLPRLGLAALSACLNCSAVHFLYTSDPPEI